MVWCISENCLYIPYSLYILWPGRVTPVHFALGGFNSLLWNLIWDLYWYQSSVLYVCAIFSHWSSVFSLQVVMLIPQSYLCSATCLCFTTTCKSLVSAWYHKQHLNWHYCTWNRNCTVFIIIGGTIIFSYGTDKYVCVWTCAFQMILHAVNTFRISKAIALFFAMCLLTSECILALERLLCTTLQLRINVDASTVDLTLNHSKRMHCLWSCFLSFFFFW